MITKVTIKGMKQACTMFGPAQAGVAKAVADSVGEGVIAAKHAEELVIVCGVFIHPAAANDRKIYDYQLPGHEDGDRQCHAGKPTVQEMLAARIRRHTRPRVLSNGLGARAFPSIARR